MNIFLIIVSTLAGLFATALAIINLIKTRSESYSEYLDQNKKQTIPTKQGAKSGKRLRAFLYLDEYLMYSISSQLFEGLTESVIEMKSKGKSNIRKQKGPISSGRVLADIISNKFDEKEKKVLHDYSYTLFEKKLLELNKVLTINENNINDLSQINNYSFININSQIYFNDIESIVETLDRYNEIGEALTYVSNFEDLDELLRRKGSVEKLAKDLGLKLDKKFLKYLITALNYGYGEHFEIQSDIGATKFTSILKQQYLKENKNLIIKKYCRESEVDFNILGLVTQYSNEYSIPSKNEIENNEEDFDHIKEAIRNLTDHLMNIENTFIGRQSNEVIVEPIAIYRNL